MVDDDLKKKEELEREAEHKINRLIILGVIILLLVVILIGILIHSTPFL